MTRKNSTISPSLVFRFFDKVFQSAALLAAAFVFFIAPAISYAAEPGKDHPLVGRYEGSALKFYQPPKYDEISFLKSPIKPQSNDHGGDVLQLEGNVSFYYYDLPKDRSLLEVQRNYETSLKAKGLEMLFSCGTANGSCYTNTAEKNPIYFADAFAQVTRWPHGDSNVVVPCERRSVRYMLAKHSADNGTTYVNVILCEATSDDSRAFVAVVESKAMDADKMVFVNASAMQKSLDATGRISLYGIYFDTDKDTIKPESKPTLDEIGKLMQANPQLRLQVVGHTDSTGGDAHNKDLSNRRAASVIRALAQTGVDAKRLTSRGAGASEPVAPNDNEAGRAKNRRVELVRM
jgi:outer membrane protein OmpA-like peptidoglycan-associated protein